ncbi:DUF2272 domain-containing protein [Chitinilyticum litopenaei]|uniref:DUF2272 domain-containing protein n=1 Tax=Chitinilyticum litopenaei TaxID=1121276 RepID=UPI00041F02EA|nr:DUF2272 domain-containing protein [Chitinilyticum litopenaei]
MKSLLVVLLLAGCATPSAAPLPVSTQPEPPAPKVAEEAVAQAVPEPPVTGGWPARMIALAQAEWEFFGRQTVVIDGEAMSMPNVGAWEDDGPAYSARVNRYWRAVGRPALDGDDCREPWSAAFMSWVMQNAGLPAWLFPPSAAHRVYLNHLLAGRGNAASVLKPRSIAEYSPKPGDLVCAAGAPAPPFAAGTPLPAMPGGALHCDLVVARDGRSIHAIGGNVRNSVSRTTLTLSPDGYLEASRRRSWFLIIENRLDW